MQQYNKASRPRLSEADDIVLKLVLRALGERHYLTASLVCRAWREAYGASVQQSKVTCCKPYLEDAAMWLHIKELGSHEGIPTALFGQYACDIALNDKLEAALSTKPTREMPDLLCKLHLNQIQHLLVHRSGELIKNGAKLSQSVQIQWKICMKIVSLLELM